MHRLAGLVNNAWARLRPASGWLVIVLSLVSAAISASFLPCPWKGIVIVISVAIALLAFSNLKAHKRLVADHERLATDHKRLAAEHDYMMARTPEGELASIAMGHHAEVELDALVQTHFEKIPGTTRLNCRHCDWHTDDFANRLRIAPEHLRQAHSDIDREPLQPPPYSE